MGIGLLWGFAIGVPIGIVIGYLTIAMRVANVPFQFLRMISPLAWMPIAVLAFETWDSAIIFLIVMATVWPIMFSTSHGVKRIDPDWFKVSRNLGASGTQMVRTIILPAIMADVMAISSVSGETTDVASNAEAANGCELLLQEAIALGAHVWMKSWHGLLHSCSRSNNIALINCSHNAHHLHEDKCR